MPVGPVAETGVAGFVPPFPVRQAEPSGEQARRFDLRQERLRNKSLHKY